MRVENFEARIGIEDYIAKYVDVPKFLAACKECPYYGVTWACPPFDFDPIEYLRKYKTLVIYCRKYIFEEDQGDYDDLDLQVFFYKCRAELAQEIYVKEKEQPGSEGLLGGACDICGLGNCARQQGKPCRFPQYMRHNMESLGGDVMKIAKDFFDIEPVWPDEKGRMPFMVFVTGLLRP